MVTESNLHGGKGFVRGDAFAIKRTITRIPAGVTISEAWLTVKSDYATVDASATFQKIITSSATASGQITDIGSDGMGEVVFEISATNTLAMSADFDYYYDIQILLSNGSIRTIERGITSALAQVTIDS